MERLADQIEDNYDNFSNFHTPQTLAWKLLMEDNIKDLSSAINSFNIDGHDKCDDPYTFIFEILITIFAEMACSLMTLLSEDDEHVRKQLNIEDFFDTITSKLKKASMLLHIQTIEKEWLENDTGYFKSIIDKRYCKVILRDNPTEEPLFNKYNVDSDMNYHMLLNPSYKQQNQLKNIIASVSTKNNIYQISFDFFKQPEMISSNECSQW